MRERSGEKEGRKGGRGRGKGGAGQDSAACAAYASYWTPIVPSESHVVHNERREAESVTESTPG